MANRVLATAALAALQVACGAAGVHSGALRPGEVGPTLLWSQPIAQPTAAAALRSDGSIVVPTAGGLVAFSAEGRPLWESAT
jgi:hypothetical protein